MEEETALYCILQCGNPCSEDDVIDKITNSKWISIQEKSLKWDKLDKFGKVYDTIDWKKGPGGLYMHGTCYVSLSSQRKLHQSEKRKVTEEESQLNLDDVSQSCDDQYQECSAPKKLRSSVGVIHDKNLCVWCMKGDFKRGGTMNKMSLLSTRDAWMKFKVHTVRLEDTETRSRLDTLISSIPDCHNAFGLEIRYHRKCWLENISNKDPLTDESSQHLQKVNFREAQALFFEYIQQVIFRDHEIRTLQSILQEYNRILSNYGHDSKVKSSYLKEILIKEFQGDIGFQERTQRNMSEIVYDTRAAGTYIEAALLSLGISDEQLLKNIASRMNEQIHQTHTIAWPPYIPDLEKHEETNELLSKLITWLKCPNKKDIDESPCVRALASMLTSYVTGKHTAFMTNISVTIHGMTKSREIADLLDKEGMGISYNDILMLRDFWALNDIERSPDCPFELADGKPAIAIVDNDDFKMDTLTGAGQAHRTNVMFVQPKSLQKDSPAMSSAGEHNICASELSQSLKNLGSQMQEVKPYKTVRPSEPPIRNRPQEEESNGTEKQRTRGVIHALARSDNDLNRPDVNHQTVPGFSGFQAKMSHPVEKSNAIYHMTYPNPPNKTILNDVMTKLAKSVEDKQMPFAIIVGDHPVYKLMLELKSENREMFEKLIPFMGPFHIQMSFIYAICKRFKGSGVDDVLVAADVIAEGSVDQALRGKHFKRGVRCLRLFYEALIHHALSKALDGTTLSQEVRATLESLRTSDDAEQLKEAHSELEENDEVRSLIETLFRDFENSPHASFYISFLEMVETLTQNIHALRTRNWKEFKSSLKLMLPWLTIYDNDKYGRHLSDFVSVLDDLSEDQEEFMESGMFAQSMTGNPYSCVGLDIWIESTMNKGSKLKSGWLAILNNEKQLLTNSRNVNNINRIRKAVHSHASHMKESNGKHADCSAAKIKQDEKAVQDISACLTEFQCDPFDLANTELRSLQSGLPASAELLADVQTAKTDGESLVQTFMDERVYSKTASLNDRIKRNKRLNFASQELRELEGMNMKGKAQEMERSALASVIGLVETSGTFQLEEVLEHRVTDECLPIFNVNGTMRKTQKSKLQQAMNMVDIPVIAPYTAIVDMGLMWRLTCPTIEDREKDDGTKYTWGDYGYKLTHFVMNRHKNAERIICANDPYNQEFSIKDSERLLRQNNKPVGNVFMKPEREFPSQREYNLILTKDENKTRLQTFLETEFRKVAQNSHIEIVYTTVGQYSKNLTKNEPEPDLLCFHAEADTALFTIYSVLRSQNYVQPVVMDSEDTDILQQAAYVANRTPGTLGIKRKHNKLIDAQQLYEDDMVDSLIPLHVITGGDHTSGFYGIGKKAVADRVAKSPEAQNLLASCGADLHMTTQTIRNLMKFVIRYVYADTKSANPREARALKWKSQKRKSLSRMVPDADSLLLHLRRANYLSYIQKHFQLKHHPSPLNHGWHLENGMCLPTRSKLPPLPQHIPQLHEGYNATWSADSNSEDDNSETNDDESDGSGSVFWNDSDTA